MLPGNNSGDASLAHSSYLERRYFASLNGLRALCIFGVLWHHSDAKQMVDDIQILSRGFLGVDIFFTISGYLITTLLLREEDRTGTISIKGFYWRRILRILPVYMLVVTVTIFYTIVVKGNYDQVGMIPYYYLFVANFLNEHLFLLGMTWSLSVEEQFYLVWPALLLLATQLSVRIVFLVGLILFCIAMMYGLGEVLNLPELRTEWAHFKWPAMDYSPLLFGSLAAILLHTPRSFPVIHALTAWRGAPVVYLFVLLAFFQWGAADINGWPTTFMNLVMVALLVSVVIREDHVLRGVMTWPPIARFGEISYGVYMYHMLAYAVVTQIAAFLGFSGFGTALVTTVLYSVLSIIIAEISFRYFEAYFLGLKDRRRNKAVLRNT